MNTVDKILKYKHSNDDYEKNFFKSKFIKMAKLYDSKNLVLKYFLIIICALVIGLFSLFLIKNTGLYSLGISSITQGLSRLVTVCMSIYTQSSSELITIISNLLFWLLIVFVNLPLLIFAYKKIGKQFTSLTLTYLIVSSIFPFLLSLIPNIDNVLFFGDINSEYLNGFDSSIKVSFLTWDSINFADSNLKINDVSKVISLIIYALIFNVLAVLPYSVIYIVGGSSAGSDIISIYYLKIKLKSLGKIMQVVNLIALLIGYFMGSYLSLGLINNHFFSYQYLFSPNFICSLLIVFLFSGLLNIVYSRFKMVSIKIIGKNIDTINDHLDRIKFKHSRTIYLAVGSYLKKTQKVMEIFCLNTEVFYLVSEIRKIDPNILIIINKNIEIDGTLTYPKFLN